MVSDIEWPHEQAEKSLQPEEDAEEQIFQPKKTLAVKGRNSFINLYKFGLKRSSKYITVLFYQQDASEKNIRTAFAVNKKYGNAVKRNLCKRRLREIAKEISPFMIPGDYLIIMKPNAAKLNYQDLLTAVQSEVLKMQKTSLK